MAALYTDIFIASPEEAEALASSDQPESSWPHLWLKHLGNLELMSLYKVLTKDTPPVSALLEDLLFRASEEGPFVVQWPADFVRSLADLSPSQITSMAASWHRIEEMSNWSQEDVVTILRSLAQFAKQSQRIGKAVLQLASFH